jgi:hypothetical protein
VPKNAADIWESFLRIKALLSGHAPSNPLHTSLELCDNWVAVD